MICIRYKHSKVKRFGFRGRNRIQRFRCLSCKATFSEPGQKPLGQHYISTDKAAQIVTLLVEGMTIRAISRFTDAPVDSAPAKHVLLCDATEIHPLRVIQ